MKDNNHRHNDNHNGTTLILRVLVPGLKNRIRQKMKEAHAYHAAANKTTTNRGCDDDDLFDIVGISCIPPSDGTTTTKDNDNHTKLWWTFRCDGYEYPARLVNLPCPVELHKTLDHTQYYKCTDVAQMLIVYRDMSEAIQDYKKLELYPSGLTPPMRNATKRRFAAVQAERQPQPTPQEVSDTEEYLINMMKRISKQQDDSNHCNHNEGRRNRKIGVVVPPPKALVNKILEEVTEDILDYEPWMDDYGKCPQGIELLVDATATDNHDHYPFLISRPELWLTPRQINEIRSTY